MSEAPTAESVPKARSHFNNWISAIGAVIATGALFSFALLVWIDFTQDNPNPYLGIFTYIVAPGFLIVGLGLVFFGAWAQRRWSIKHAATKPDKWRLDFTRPAQRRRIIAFGIGALGFIMLSAFGSYQTYHYAESVQFCGEVCHTAMNPEFVAYHRSAHARVDCVDCHVGEGVKWAIKAKVNGTHQLIAYMRDNYNRPIETPLAQIRPAEDICAKCHWPEKEHGKRRSTLRPFPLRQSQHRLQPPHAPPRDRAQARWRHRRHSLARRHGRKSGILRHRSRPAGDSLDACHQGVGRQHARLPHSGVHG